LPYNDLFIGKMMLVGDCEGAKMDMDYDLRKYIDKATRDIIANVNPWEASDIPECCPPSTSPCWTPWVWRQGSFCLLNGRLLG
jgi:hypothetical protein